jgi:hypothetical protein
VAFRADVHRCNCCGQSGYCNLCTCPASVSITYDFEFGFEPEFPARGGGYPSLPNNEHFSEDWSMDWSGSATLYRGCTCGEACSTNVPIEAGNRSADLGCIPCNGSAAAVQDCWRCSRYGCSGRTGCVDQRSCGGTSTDAVDMAYAQASISATGEVRPRYSIYPQQTSPWYEFEEMEDLTIWGGCSRTVNADLNRLYLGFQTGGSRCVVDTQATGCAGRNGRKEITGTGCKKVGESGLSSGDTLCAHAAVVFQSGIITPGDSSGCLEDVTWSVQRVAIGWLGSQGRGCGTLGNAPMNVNTDGLWTGVTLSWSLSVT